MGRSQAAKAETHDRIVQIASERFREAGLDGVSVADLMKEAGLTVGGFYKHFSTREDLVAEAVARGQGAWQARMAKATSEEEKPTIAELIDGYLSAPHRDAPGRGCPAGALVGEIARSGPQTRALFTEGLKDTLVLLIDRLRAAGIDADNATLRRTAISIYSAMIGAIGAARAVDDPALSEEIMCSTAAQIKTLALPPEAVFRTHPSPSALATSSGVVP
jgi:TetR/AcrR family transcriptional repressor of nem operon